MLGTEFFAWAHVVPSLFGMLGSAPYSNRVRAESVSPRSAARYSAVSPSWFCILTFLVFVSSSFRISGLLTALCRAVYCSLSTTSGSAPCSNNTSTHFSRFFRAASLSAVHPLEFWWSNGILLPPHSSELRNSSKIRALSVSCESSCALTTECKMVESSTLRIVGRAPLSQSSFTTS